ncbi:DUF5813 family protein [Natrarchaeobius chitinivorans]|uniref:YbjN domain-containing protein n=1 Tax=Natrarchaeobius chitinivorans TaxID=1679083 RepID=A0A3N6MBH6_NATCH|nr:DUF5813 family protein [Natrarchaeobius chitinivorans]RQG98034.1 hypothetical protein EA473_02265 [Natrarchaeobius chitinivorans]
MASIPTAVERALEAHDAFAVSGEGYELETTVFETAVTATETTDERDGRFTVVVTLPTLDAAVANETVAPVVEDGWFETLERRLADVFTVAHTNAHEDPIVERDATDVSVTLEYASWNAREGVEDAKALVEYVEGTFAQGIVPGYEYRGPAATLLESAQSRGQQAEEDGTGANGGMPM